MPYSRTSSEETTTTPQDFLKFIYGQYSEEGEEIQQQNQNSNEVTTELNLDFLSMEQSESEESSSSTVRSLLFSSEITTTNWPNFLPKSSDNDDQKIQEGLNDESEDLLTFQSGFMPTPFQRTKSKNKTRDQGKNQNSEAENACVKIGTLAVAKVSIIE